MTVLNRVSLLRIREDAVRGLESAVLRGNQEHMDHFSLQLEAAEGLLNNMNDPRAEEWKAYIERTTSDPDLSHVSYGSVTSANPKNETEPLTINRMEGGSISFSLKEKMMVNLSVDMSNMGLIGSPNFPSIPNVALRLSGTRDGGGTIDWPSNKKGSSGESVSAMLDAGTYTLTIEDKTIYANAAQMTMEQKMKLHLPTIPVRVEINRYNSAKIEGKISIEGSPKVMPVSMSVAEFDPDTGKRKEDYDATSGKEFINKLNPNLPIWVVVHGRRDNELSGKMEDLAKALTEFAAFQGKGAQVVTIDWSEAAKDFNSINPDAWDISDSRWTKAVGEWFAKQLLALSPDFDPGLFSGFFHSHANAAGSYAAEFLYKKTGKQINLFVSMDPAKNPGIAGGSAEYNAINAGAFAKNSIAFDSSWLGSSHFSGTAKRSFVVQPESNDVDPSSGNIDDEILEHGASVAVVSSIIRESIKSEPNLFGRYLNMNDLLSGRETLSLQSNVLAGDEQPFGGTPYEGEIVIRTDVRQDRNGDAWLGGTPISLQYKRPDGVAIRESVSGLILEDAADKPLTRGISTQSWIGDINTQNKHSFTVDSLGQVTLRFAFPKPGTLLLAKISQLQAAPGYDPQILPAFATLHDAQRELSVPLTPGKYELTILQEAPSQSLGVLNRSTYADMPYTVTLQ